MITDSIQEPMNDNFMIFYSGKENAPVSSMRLLVPRFPAAVTQLLKPCSFSSASLDPEVGLSRFACRKKLPSVSSRTPNSSCSWRFFSWKCFLMRIKGSDDAEWGLFDVVKTRKFLAFWRMCWNTVCSVMISQSSSSTSAAGLPVVMQDNSGMLKGER